MNLSRRSFLRRSTLAVAGGLIVGDKALALLEQLTHRKVWALGGIPDVRTLWASTPWQASDMFATIRYMALYDERTGKILALGTTEPRGLTDPGPLQHTFPHVAPGGTASGILALDAKRRPLYQIEFDRTVRPNGGDITVEATEVRFDGVGFRTLLP